MKKLFILALAVTSVVACKRKAVESGAPVNENEIQIGASMVSVTKAMDPNSTFDATSQIGIFNVKHVDFVNSTAAVFTPFDASQTNVGYAYAGPTPGDNAIASSKWTAVNKDVLKWQFESGGSPELKGVLVAYHPYNPDATKVVGKDLTFAIPTDQTIASDLRKADLLWAASTGKNASSVYENLAPGYAVAVAGTGLTKTKDAKDPINMHFHHMLTKLMFTVGIYETKDATETFSNIKIAKVYVEGPAITTTGKLDLLKGVYTADANVANTSGSIAWAPAADKALDLGTPAANKAAIATYTDVCQLIAAPVEFAATASGNQLKFDVTYDYLKSGSTLENRKKTYTFSLVDETKLTVPGTLNYNFVKNDAVTFKVALNISSNEIFVTSTIAPWNPVQHDIEGN